MEPNLDRIEALVRQLRSTAGKTLKRELRAPYWKGRGRTI